MKEVSITSWASMTFSEYIIRERSQYFYIENLKLIAACGSTLEDWFKDMYYDYKLLFDNSTPTIGECIEYNEGFL